MYCDVELLSLEKLFTSSVVSTASLSHSFPTVQVLEVTRSLCCRGNRIGDIMTYSRLWVGKRRASGVCLEATRGLRSVCI